MKIILYQPYIEHINRNSSEIIKTLTTENKTLKEKNKQLKEKNKQLDEKNKQLYEKNKKLVVANNIFKQKIYVDNNNQLKIEDKLGRHFI